MKELGRYALLNHEASLEVSGLALFTRELGLSKDEAIGICSNAVEELKKWGEIHVYNMHHFVIARRPLQRRKGGFLLTGPRSLDTLNMQGSHFFFFKMIHPPITVQALIPGVFQCEE